ncbi:hypothetical protein N2J84_002170 [Vibrio vulnificus]|nr:hypothetical protein [Vibrio vulnificus]
MNHFHLSIKNISILIVKFYVLNFLSLIDDYNYISNNLSLIAYFGAFRSVISPKRAIAITEIRNNEFILESYWHYHSGRITEEQWRDARSKVKITANTALGNNNTALVLAVVFSRLYTLRNQIIHGGATFGSSANRKQLRGCTVLLEQMLPVIIKIMMDSSNELWGDPVYPLIQK